MNFGFKWELVLKILIINFIFLSVPKIELNLLYLPVIFIVSAISVFMSGILLDSKAFARTILIVALMMLSFRLKQNYIIVIIVLLLLWYVQGEIRSRTLQVICVVFVAQLCTLKYIKNPHFVWLFPLIYPLLLALVALLFLNGQGIIHDSASNLARSTILYSILINLYYHPFGFEDLSNCRSVIGNVVEKLYSDGYIDPHNLFASAAAWGGWPLLIFTMYSFYKGIYKTVQNRNKPDSIFAAVVLSVLCSTQTLSLVNVLMFVLVLLYLKHSCAKQKC